MTRTTKKTETGDALRECFVSPNVPDVNLEPANVVDVVARLANAVERFGASFHSDKLSPDDDVNITQAVAEIQFAITAHTQAVDRVADGLHAIADAIRERGA